MPLNDLDTVRDTLAAIHADLRRVPGLELASELIETALVEIAVVERRRLTRFPVPDARPTQLLATQELSGSPAVDLARQLDDPRQHGTAGRGSAPPRW